MIAFVTGRPAWGLAAVLAAPRLRRALTRQWAVAYGIPLVASVGATFSWFQPGRFIAAGDVAPFLRDGLASQLWSSWNHQVTGAGSSSFEVARALDVVLIAAVRLVGGSELVAQHLLYALLLGGAALGSAYLAAAVVNRPAAVAVAGLVGAFNPLVMVLLPNPLPLAAIAIAGLLGGLVLRRARGDGISAAAIALATVPVSYLAVNPPLLAVVAVWCAALPLVAGALFGWSACWRAARTLLGVAPLALVMALWWLVPLVQTIAGGAGVELAAETDVGAWSWSHADNSLANVVTLKAHWGWPHRDLYPYAETLDAGVWPLLRWALPVLAVAAVPLAPRRFRRLAGLLVAVAAGLVLVGKGLHEPWVGLNAALYDHLPGFWLLREPMSKVGPVLVLLYGVLAAVAVAGMAERAERWNRRAAWGGRSVVAVTVAASLAYAWPMWRGDAIPRERGSLPGAHVAVPEEWRQAAAVVNESPVAGKVLMLPLQPYYQVTTSWGYHGVPGAPQLFRRPVIQRLPGGYYGDADTFDALLDRLERDLQVGAVDRIPRLLDALGVGHVVVRRDTVPGVGGRPVVGHDVLVEALRAVPGMREAADLTVAGVFAYEGGGVVAALSDVVRYDGASHRLADVVAALPPSAAVAAASGPADAAVVDASATSFTLERSGRYHLSRSERSVPRYRATVATGERGPALRLEPLTTITVDGQQVATPSPITVGLEQPAIAAVGDAEGLKPLTTDGATVVAGTGTTITAWAGAGSRELTDFSPLEDCANVDGRSPDEAGLRLERSQDGIRLAATAHAACTWTEVTPFESGAVHRVTFEHRTTSGAPARFCVWQAGLDRCAEAPPIETSGAEWRTHEVLVRPEPGATGLRLYVYADGVAEGTVAEYRSVSVQLLRRVAAHRVVSGSDPRSVEELDAGEHRVQITSGEGSDRLPLGDPAPVGDCNAYDQRTPAEVGLLMRRRGPIVELSARDHAACTWMTVADGTGAVPPLVAIRFEHRTLDGRPPRICVWQAGPDTCARTPELVRSADWQPYEAVVEPEPGTSELVLYLYADGDDGRRTVNAYRHIEASALPPASLVVARADRADRVPGIEVSTERPDRHRVRIADADGPFLLRLADSYAPGWQLTGLPDGWAAEHVEVDGYANGWLVDGRGDATVTLSYQPAATSRLLATGAGLAIVVAGAFLLVGSWRRRRSPGRLPAGE